MPLLPGPSESHLTILSSMVTSFQGGPLSFRLWEWVSSIPPPGRRESWTSERVCFFFCLFVCLFVCVCVCDPTTHLPVGSTRTGLLLTKTTLAEVSNSVRLALPLAASAPAMSSHTLRRPSSFPFSCSGSRSSPFQTRRWNGSMGL